MPLCSSIPEEVIEAAECDGITGMSQFWKIKLPLILPSIGIISILTFVGNFNAFDLIYTAQGALAGPNYSTDILGTFLYRTFFGFQLQVGDPNMGAAIATMMFLIILGRRLRLPVRSCRRACVATSSEGASHEHRRPFAPRTIGAHAILIDLHGDRAVSGDPGHHEFVQVARRHLQRAADACRRQRPST